MGRPGWQQRRELDDKIPAAVEFISPTEHGYDIGYRVAGQADQQVEPFALVTLAVGFGVEPKGTGRNSYWEQDPLDQMVRPKEIVLIAGYGDGALTDLMRVCMKDFEHEKVLAEIVRRTPGKEVGKIKQIEREAKDAASLTKAYAALKIPDVQAYLRERLAQTARCFLLDAVPIYSIRAQARSIASSCRNCWPSMRSSIFRWVKPKTWIWRTNMTMRSLRLSGRPAWHSRMWSCVLARIRQSPRSAATGTAANRLASFPVLRDLETAGNRCSRLTILRSRGSGTTSNRFPPTSNADA